MNRFLSILVLSFVFFTSAFSVDIRSLIIQCEFLLYIPSIESGVNNTKSILKHFYGKNYNQMMEQIGANSKSLYGIDILDLKSMDAAGIDIKKAISYVHLSNQTGYLLIPVTSRKTIENYIKKNIGDSLPYKIADNYLLISQNKQTLETLNSSNRLDNNESFQLAVEKLGFNWDRNFAWIESRYLSSVSSAIGVSSNLKLPYGFTAIILDFLDQNISLKSYAGILSEDQSRYIGNMRTVSAEEKFNLTDFIWGNPALIGSVYLNVPMIYKYYSYIDTINILGLKGFIAELWQDYKINIERDLINNCDGRMKIVIDKYDSINNDYVLYGSIGIKNIDTAKAFIDSLKNGILQTDNKLFSFELFSKPFYHYKSTNYSIYYGLVENDFVFTTDKEILVKLAKNIYENNSGYMDKMPSFFQNAVTDKKVGYFITIDVQSLFSNFKTGFEINKNLLVGIKDIYIYGNPDLGDKPYGWFTTADINFYK